MAGNPWDKLDKQIKRCGDCGFAPTFWWRDDDASEPTNALTRLTELARTFDIPLTLAVIPAQAGAALRHELGNTPFVTAVQHGYAHVNHAPAGGKKCEFALTRPIDALRGDLARGQALMANFTHSAPVFVPPWNRMDDRLMPVLADLGFSGISQFGAAPTTTNQPSLRRLNTHVDVIAWKTTRGFVGLEPAIDAICDHLAKQCLGQTNRAEATGLLTHHLVHDEETWQFLSTLFDFSRNYSTIKWLPVRSAMAMMNNGAMVNIEPEPNDSTVKPNRKS